MALQGTFDSGYTIKKAIYKVKRVGTDVYDRVHFETSSSMISDATDLVENLTVVKRDSQGKTQLKTLVLTETSLPPLVVNSSNKVINLNADKVDGFNVDNSLNTGVLWTAEKILSVIDTAGSGLVLVAGTCINITAGAGDSVTIAHSTINCATETVTTGVTSGMPTTVVQDLEISSQGHITKKKTMNLDDRYSVKTHNHDSAYATVGHTHSYSPTNHNHEGVYLKTTKNTNNSIQMGNFTISYNSTDKSIEFSIA